jgi:hypothetical protein
VVEFILDVTDRKAVEQAVLEGEVRLRSIIEGIEPPRVHRRLVGLSQAAMAAGSS